MGCIALTSAPPVLPSGTVSGLPLGSPANRWARLGAFFLPKTETAPRSASAYTDSARRLGLVPDAPSGSPRLTSSGTRCWNCRHVPRNTVRTINEQHADQRAKDDGGTAGAPKKGNPR